MSERVADEIGVYDVMFGGRTASCEVCSMPTWPTSTYEGHVLCPSCALLGCGQCWKAMLVLRRGRLWRRFNDRYVCPNCGWKGRWLF